MQNDSSTQYSSSVANKQRAIIFFVVIGVLANLILYNHNRNIAYKSWTTIADGKTQELTNTLLGWLDESYSALMALNVLIENSDFVSESEFLNSSDSIEANAGVIFLRELALLKLESANSNWTVNYSNDPYGILTPQTQISSIEQLQLTLNRASTMPGQTVLGPPLIIQGKPFSLVVLTIPGEQQIAVAGIVDYAQLLDSLKETYLPDGIGLNIQGQFLGSLSSMDSVISIQEPNELHSVISKSVSANSELIFHWSVSDRFLEGPSNRTAFIVLFFGIAGVITIALFLWFLIRQNKLISDKVELATSELELASASLQESEQQFRNIFTNVPGVIYSCLNDENWTMKYISNAIEELSGYQTEDFINNQFRSYTSIIHPEDKQIVKDEITNSLENQSQFQIEYRILTKNGSIKWVNERGQIYTDSNVKQQIVNGCIIDVTTRKTFEVEMKKLSIALEQSPVSVVITDTHGNIEYVNPKFCEVTGYGYHEAIGQNPRILKSDDGNQEIYEELWQTITAGNEWSGEFHNKKKNGELYWESATISPIFSDEGIITHYLAVKENITARKEMEESIQRINFQADQALELTKAGYWHVPLDGSGWYNSSERAAAIFGDPPRPPHYRYRVMEEWFDNVKAGDETAAQETYDNFQEAVNGKIPIYNSTYAYKRPIDGNIVWIHASGHVIKDEKGTPTDMYGVTQDITDRILIEQDLQKRLNELHDFQTAMLNIMEDLDVEKQKANEATKAKSDFLASMSHEIRTPLNGMIANLELLELSDVSEEQQKTIGSAKFCADTLLAIIGDILDFSKIEAGKMELDIHEMDLRSALKNIHSMILPRAVQKGIHLHMFIAPDVPEKVMADSIRVRQIVVNLIGNAIKFTEYGGVLIQVTRFEDEAGESWIRFNIVDSGVGFAPEKAGKLFEAFSQEEQTTTRKFGGTGLGLAICKRITDMKKGQIGCTGSPGFGAHFYCQLPLPIVEESEAIQTEWLQDYYVIIIQDGDTDINELTDRLQQHKVNTHVLQLEELKEENLRITSPFGGYRDCIFAVTNRPEHIAWHPLINANRPRRWMLLSQSKSPNSSHIALRQGFSYYQFDEINWNDVYQFILSVGTQSNGIPSKESLTNSLSGIFDSIQQKKIKKPLLVIDDFEMNRHVAVKQLKAFGLTCETAVNGKEGLDKAKENDYALIFVDWMMPVMDGIEFANQYRRWEIAQGKHIPVIAMTANALKGDEERCLKAGMDDYLSKPVKMERLGEVLSKWLLDESVELKQNQVENIESATVLYQQKSEEKEKTPPISLSYLSEILGEDDLQELAETLDMYKDELDNLLTEITIAFENQDRQALRDASHKAKGGASYAAAIPLSEIYKDLQLSALESPWDDLQDKFESAKQEWQQVKQFIERLNQNTEAS